MVKLINKSVFAMELSRVQSMLHRRFGGSFSTRFRNPLLGGVNRASSQVSQHIMGKAASLFDHVT